MNSSTNFKVYIAIFFSMIFWGVSFIWTEIAFENGYTPIMTVFFRLILSSIFLISLNFWLKKLQKVSGKNLKLFFLLSFLQPFLYFLGESYGLTYVSATVAAVIIATIPLFSPIAAYYFFKEKISLMNIIGISISIFGVLLVLLKDDLSIKANPKRGHLPYASSILCYCLFCCYG
jgi:drug/metabolite transporter (DMT)-like permease